MKRPVVTIEEPNGHIRYASLPYYLHEDADIKDMREMIQLVNYMARVEAGAGTILDIEWKVV